MHKSKGNFITMKGAVERYGADATRCALLLGAEEMDDPDWRSDNAADVQGKLEAWSKFAEDLCSSTKNKNMGSLGAMVAKQAPETHKHGVCKPR